MTAASITSGQDGAEEPEPALRRAPRIREEDVRQTADALLVEGTRPTVERIRARLGRGSPNTIALFLDRWWTQLGARLRDLPGQELPSVPEPVSRALVDLWSQAIDEARALLHESLATRHADIEAQRATLDARTAELERAQNEFARERAALEQTVIIVQKQLGEANDRHRADIARLEELRQECTRLVSQQDAIRREGAESARRLEAVWRASEEERRTLLERVDAAERHSAKQVDEARLALSTERKRVEALERQRTIEVDRLRQELQLTQTERANLQMELERTREALAAARSACDNLKATAQQHEARADGALKSLHEVQLSAVQRFETLQKELRRALRQPKGFSSSTDKRGPRRTTKQDTGNNR